ncbi:RNA polymerase II subunit A C-terminal domain phosphatase SSU72 [Plecturocebus cupreus]
MDGNNQYQPFQKHTKSIGGSARRGPPPASPSVAHPKEASSCPQSAARRSEAPQLGGSPSGSPTGCEAAAMPSSPLWVTVVCSSNQNRSMEVHNILSKRGFSVRSFGTGTHVKLPGPAPDKPNVYDFKTTYDQMYNDLLRKDKELYTQNSILHMLDRNKRIKPQPERFQNCKDLFDLILTCEERVYELVVEDLNTREQETCQPVHVVNVDIRDNYEEATLGAFLISELCQCIQHTEDMENETDELLQEFEEKSGRTFLHTVCFY